MIDRYGEVAVNCYGMSTVDAGNTEANYDSITRWDFHTHAITARTLPDDEGSDWVQSC